MLGKLGLKKKGSTPPASGAPQGDQQAAERARAAQLAKVMFADLDQDQDGVLLCHEVQVRISMFSYCCCQQLAKLPKC